MELQASICDSKTSRLPDDVQPKVDADSDGWDRESIDRIMSDMAYGIDSNVYHNRRTEPNGKTVISTSTRSSPCITCLSRVAHPWAIRSTWKRFSGPFSISVLPIATALPLRTISQPALPAWPKIQNSGENPGLVFPRSWRAPMREQSFDCLEPSCRPISRTRRARSVSSKIVCCLQSNSWDQTQFPRFQAQYRRFRQIKKLS